MACISFLSGASAVRYAQASQPRRKVSIMSPARKQVAVVIGATSKWQADGRNTQLAHGKAVDDSDLPVGIRWGVGGAIAQKFAKEGFFVVLTTRTAANASALEQAIKAQGGDSMIVELDLVSQDSISQAFATIRERGRRPACRGLQRRLPRGARPAAREGAAGAHPRRDVRDRAAHRQPRSVPGRQGGAARHAQARRGHLPHHQQLVVPARTQAHDRPVAVLPARDDAHAGAGADGGVFRAWRARGQRRDRRPDRLARDPSPAARPAAARRWS